MVRNNINGDYSKLVNISSIKPGGFINISWKKKDLMLPYSLKKGYLSFNDNKWDWRYELNQDGSINESNPVLYEVLPTGKIEQHSCSIDNN